MRTATLIQIMRELSRRGRWCVSESTLRTFIPEPENTFRAAMTRHVRTRIVDRIAPGLYLNPYASVPAWAPERLASHLRPHDSMYVSLESALHEHGYISQVPSRLTLMTSGRSYTYNTPLGVIEFVHTSRATSAWRERSKLVLERGIHVASAELALEDLRHVRRNLGLVEGDD